LATRLRGVSCSEVLTSFKSGNDESGTFDGSPFGNGSVDQLVMADASVRNFVFPTPALLSPSHYLLSLQHSSRDVNIGGLEAGPTLYLSLS